MQGNDEETVNGGSDPKTGETSAKTEGDRAETVQPKQPITMLRDQMELLAERSKSETDAEKLTQLSYAMKGLADTHAQLEITFMHREQRA